MNLYYCTKSQVSHGTATLRNAVDSAKRNTSINLIASDINGCFLHAQTHMSCSSVQSKLIEYVGRYTESYGCDLLDTLCKLDAFLRTDATADDEYGRWVICIGIRAIGVDHDDWIMDRLRDNMDPWTHYTSHRYRKILALDIEDVLDDDYRRTTVQLFDITHNVGRVAEEDVK